MTFNYQKVCQKVLGPLPQRQREIIARRFGLGDNPPETLQKIGDDFGITRERIRQIEKESFRKLEKQKGQEDLKRVFVFLEEHLRRNGGARREDRLLQDLGRVNRQNPVRFFLFLGDPFYRFPETEDVYPFWAVEKNISPKIKEIVANLLRKFEGAGRPLVKDSLFEKEGKRKSSELAFSALEITKKIEQGPLGEFGLTTWPEIKPRGVRDQAYLTLKKTGRPLHFRDIAKFSSQLPREFFHTHRVLPQTVHNELIRDERFILVGRGIYGLREWGYAPGTVKDIILKILREKEKPLSRGELLKEVLNQRLVKENTILLNLADRNYFLRDEKGRYLLKEN